MNPNHPCDPKELDAGLHDLENRFNSHLDRSATDGKSNNQCEIEKLVARPQCDGYDTVDAENNMHSNGEDEEGDGDFDFHIEDSDIEMQVEEDDQSETDTRSFRSNLNISDDEREDNEIDNTRIRFPDLLFEGINFEILGMTTSIEVEISKVLQFMGANSVNASRKYLLVTELYESQYGSAEYRDEPLYQFAYISDCMKKKQLLDIENYKLVPSPTCLIAHYIYNIDSCYMYYYKKFESCKIFEDSLLPSGSLDRISNVQVHDTLNEEKSHENVDAVPCSDLKNDNQSSPNASNSKIFSLQFIKPDPDVENNLVTNKDSANNADGIINLHHEQEDDIISFENFVPENEQNPEEIQRDQSIKPSSSNISEDKMPFKTRISTIIHESDVKSSQKSLIPEVITIDDDSDIIIMDDKNYSSHQKPKVNKSTDSPIEIIKDDNKVDIMVIEGDKNYSNRKGDSSIEMIINKNDISISANIEPKCKKRKLSDTNFPKERETNRGKFFAPDNKLEKGYMILEYRSSFRMRCTVNGCSVSKEPHDLHVPILRQHYSHYEHKIMIIYLVKNECINKGKGLAVWQNFINEGFLTHRTIHSLCKTFRKIVLPRINDYKLPKSIEKLFLDLKEKKRN